MCQDSPATDTLRTRLTRISRFCLIQSRSRGLSHMLRKKCQNRHLWSSSKWFQIKSKFPYRNRYRQCSGRAARFWRRGNRPMRCSQTPLSSWSKGFTIGTRKMLMAANPHSNNTWTLKWSDHELRNVGHEYKTFRQSYGWCLVVDRHCFRADCRSTRWRSTIVGFVVV